MDYSVFHAEYTGDPYYCPDTSSFEIAADHYADDFKYVKL